MALGISAMNHTIPFALLEGAVGFGITALLVYMALKLCTVRGWVAKPRPERWHQGSPCLYGGVPLWLGFVLACLLLLPVSSTLAKLLVFSSMMFAAGLLDDIFCLSPRKKLLIQLAVAGLTVGSGIVYPLRHELLLNVAISLLWIVGITNAFNLLDNMDGLAGGIALIAATYLGLFYMMNGLPQHAEMLAVFGGAVAAFLVFNYNPARIFMGDAGSLFIGFFLGAASLLDVTHISGLTSFLFVPVLVLVVPILDTFFVSCTRKLRGQAVSQGGTDHTSHRLVRHGLNERGAVQLLYAVSALSGAVALALRRLHLPHALGLVAFCFLFLLIFGIHVFSPAGDVCVDDWRKSDWSQRLLTRDMLALLLDPLALSLSYFLAYFLRFGASVPGGDLVLFFASWPIVLSTKIASLWLSGTYRHSWWRDSGRGVYQTIRATLIGEVIALMCILAWNRFAGYSRAVFVLDTVISCSLLVAIRASSSVFWSLMGGLRAENSDERRVLLMGTSHQTGMALRYLRDQRIKCIGLIDTNGGADLGKRVWGLQVVGRVDDVGRVASLYRVDEVVLPDTEVLASSCTEFADLCMSWNVRLTRLGLYSGNLSHRELNYPRSRAQAS